MKKYLGFLVGFAVVLSAVFVVPVAEAASFPDVPEDHPNFQAIQFLKDNGYIGGYADLTFKPENEINRAEAVKIIVSALKIPEAPDSLVLFGDVVESEWYFPYVMGAYEAGIVAGDGNGFFRPADTVNLAEALKIVSEALDTDLPEVPDDDEFIFADVTSDDWFVAYALYAKENNILLMDDYGEVNPGDPMTRAKFAEIMYRYIRVSEDKKPFPIEEEWDFYSSVFLPFKAKVPEGWEIISCGDSLGDGLGEIVFWKNDKGYYQFSPERIYPNTAKVVVSLDKNLEELDENEYFSNVKMVFASGEASSFEFDGFDALEISYPDQYIRDWYIYLDEGSWAGKVLVVYTQNGTGMMAYQNRKFLDAVLSTFAYIEVGGGTVADDESADVKSEIFENILVEGKGESILELLSDEYIIETDSIGVGTGPIDYYYSAEVDLTLKYERAGDVILDYREGITTAF